MAHQLDQSAGRVAFAYTGAASAIWHGLGQQIAEEATEREWIEASGLDWRIAPRDCPYMDEGGRVLIGVGSRTEVGKGVWIGERARIYPGARIASGTRVGEWARIGPDTWIGEGAQIGSGARISEGAQTGSGSWIDERVYIGEGVRIASSTTIGERAQIGSHSSIGPGTEIDEGAYIGAKSRIGDSAHIYHNAVFVHDLGFTDGWRKCLVTVDGVYYIDAGCRHFTMAEALAHWGDHEENRRITMIQLAYAQGLIDLFENKKTEG